MHVVFNREAHYRARVKWNLGIPERIAVYLCFLPLLVQDLLVKFALFFWKSYKDTHTANPTHTYTVTLSLSLPFIGKRHRVTQDGRPTPTPSPTP